MMFCKLTLFIVWALFFSCLHSSAAFAESKKKTSLTVLGILSPGEEELINRLLAILVLQIKAASEFNLIPVENTTKKLGLDLYACFSHQPISNLKKRFQQGYWETYNFEYKNALTSFREVLSALRQVPPTKARWDLYVNTQSYLGIAHAGNKDTKNSEMAFHRVLRTRPKLILSRLSYSPKSISAWEKAKKKLAKLPRGTLNVDSTPQGAMVILDGVEMGRTPYQGKHPYGFYHLQLDDVRSGSVSKQIEVKEQAVSHYFGLPMETRFCLGEDAILMRYANNEKTKANHNRWNWLLSRLEVDLLLVLITQSKGGKNYFVLTRFDHDNLQEPLEIWQEIGSVSGKETDYMEVAFINALNPITKTKEQIRAPLPKEKHNPWWKKWWPYTLAGVGFLALGAGSHLLSEQYRRDAKQVLTVNEVDHYNRLSHIWLGVAVTGYVLCGGLLLTGWIMEEIYPFPLEGDGVGHNRITPWIESKGIGLRWQEFF